VIMIDRRLKGQCHEIFCLLFFIKQLLVLVVTPRKNFEFGRIFVEVFLFVIDSRVYSLPGSRPILVSKTLPGAKYSRESRLSCNDYTVES
jgi:hypothetical protein